MHNSLIFRISSVRGREVFTCEPEKNSSRPLGALVTGMLYHKLGGQVWLGITEPTGTELVAEFKEDLERYRSYGERYWRIFLNPAVWCIFWYRLGRWIYSPGGNIIVKGLGRPFHLIGATLIEIFLQMRINVRAEIGPGLLIAHCGGITLHPDVVIGRHCDLAHHVTLGTRGVGSRGVPKLGNNVYVGTNAVLIGPIRVEDGAKIAANSLVNRDVPAGATVMGVPAVVMKRTAELQKVETRGSDGGGQ